MSRIHSTLWRRAVALMARNKTVVVLTLVIALTSSGTAAAAVAGDPFRLGVVNSINALTRLSGSLANTLLAIQNTSTAAGARALHLLSQGPLSTAFIRNAGTGPALQLKVGAGRPPILVNADAGKATNLNADKLDGLEGSAFVRGRGMRVLSNRLVLASGEQHAGSVLVPLLDVPGLGSFGGVCGDDHHTGVITWRNSAPAPIDVWHMMGTGDDYAPLVVDALSPTIYTFASHTVGGRMFGGSLVLGSGDDASGTRRTASVHLHVHRQVHDGPCVVQIMAMLWTTP